MPGTNLTREEAQTRARLLAVESYTVDLDLTDQRDDLRLDHHDPVHAAASPGPRPSPTSSARRVHEITLNGAALDPATAYADSRIALDRPRGRQRARASAADCPTATAARACTASSTPPTTGSTSTRQFEVPGRPPRVHHLRAARPQVRLHLQRHRAGALDGRLQRPDPGAARRPATASPCGTSRPPERMSTYITALVAGEYHEVLDTYEGKQRHHPARPLLPPVAGRAPRPRRAGRSSPSRASRSSRRPSTTPTRSGSTTSSTCRSTTWARWRTPAA